MNDHPIDRLSEFLDGDLAAGERDAVERHLAGCPSCATVLSELGALVERAGTLADRPPARDLWPGIRERIAPDSAVVPITGARRPRRRFRISVPELAAAAVALVVVTASVVWWIESGGPVAEVPVGAPVATAPAGGIEPVADLGDAEYRSAIGELEAALEATRDRLDPETVAAVERNLAIIDAALRETEAALRADPNSAYLYDYLVQTRLRKLRVLREATTILRSST